jgi:hypothetical protein
MIKFLLPLLVATTAGLEAKAQYYSSSQASPVMNYCISQLGTQACICINQLQNAGYNDGQVMAYCQRYVQSPAPSNTIQAPFISF